MKRILKIPLVIISFVITGIILMGILNICPPSGPWPMPPWCEDQNSYSSHSYYKTQNNVSNDTYYYSYIPNKNKSSNHSHNDKLSDKHIQTETFEYLKIGKGSDFLKKPVFFIDWVKDKSFYDKIPKVSINWRWEWFEGGKPTKNTIDNIKWFHSRDIHYIGYQHPATSQGDTNPIVDKKFAAVDLYGNPIYYKKPGLGDSWEKGQYWANLLDPDWQELLINQCKMMIDAGVEGIIFDEPNFNREVIFSKGGSFDKHSMNGFKEYLKSKYTNYELSEKFGINNIYEFNFKNYIINKNMETSWNKDPIPAITKEFANFQTLESSNVIRNISNTLKEYGYKKYDHEILFSMNAGPEFISHLMQTDFQDYGMGEHFYFGRGTTQKAAVTIKLSEGLWKNKYVVLGEVSHDKGEIPNKNNKNLFKYAFADTYSSDGRLILDGDRFMTLRNWNYVDFDDYVYYNVDEAAKYINFAYEHPELYSLNHPSKVAVVHSIASRKGGSGLIDLDERNVWTENSIKGIIEMLLNLNIPFNIIVSGDNELFKEKISKYDLDKYDVVIMPAVFMLDDSEIEAIFDYVSNGGHVIVINKFGTHNKKGEKIKRTRIINLKNGENKIGKGTIYVISENIGEQYFYDNTGRTYLPTERTLEDIPLKLFKNALYKYYTPEITTNAPLTVNIKRYTDNKRMVLHIVNYDYDHTKDIFNVIKSFNITVSLLGLKPEKAILYDFENNQEKEIDIFVKNGKATITVPFLYAYDIVELI